jgi:DNA polymerase
MTGSQAKAHAALLAWYDAMGVDEAIGDAPVDRFAIVPETWPSKRPAEALAGRLAKAPLARPEEAPADKRAKTPLARPAPAAPTPAHAAPDAAPPCPASLEAVSSLAELQALVAQFEGCALKRTAKSLCFSRGSADARIMLIGEAPGRDEDIQGKPFVGRAGKLLDRMLSTIGLDETKIYITNTIYWRPPGNRTPTPQEIGACAPFLSRQIELVAPDVLVLLGGAAAKHILGVTEGIMRLRGKWKIYKNADRDIPTLATLHPAYLLRSPEAKRYAWRDLLMLKTRLEETPK